MVTRQNTGTAVGIFITAALIGIIVFVGGCHQKLQSELYKERANFFQMFSEKTIHNLDTSINDYWFDVMSCVYTLRQGNLPTENAVARRMRNIGKNIRGNSVFLAFDDGGQFYSSDGHRGYLRKEDLFDFWEDGPNWQTGSAQLPYGGGESTYFVLMMPLESRIPAGEGLSIDWVALFIDMMLFEDMVTADGFDASVHMYLTTEDGDKIYRNHRSEDLIRSQNVLREVENNALVIGGGNMEDLVASFDREADDVFQILFKGEDYFFGTRFVPSAHTQLVMFAPTRVISAEAASIQRISFIMMVSVTVAILMWATVLILFIHHSARKNREMVVKLSEAVEQVKMANESKSEFLSYMSHDIRTPLNGIIGMTQIISKNYRDPEKVQLCANKILGASSHLLSLLNDVLDLTRIERGRTTPNLQPMNIEATYHDCCSIISGQLIGRELELVEESDPISHPEIISDELHLRQILINILGNAVKFTPDGGKIYFRMQELPADGDQIAIRFQVEDTGIGMSREFMKTIWDPFVQSRDSHRTQYKGSGLGMTITKNFVEMLQGDISVSSEPGVGSIFTLNFKFRRNQTPGKPQADAEQTGDLKGMRILLVEDNALNQEIAQEILLDAGAAVETADNGQEACDRFLSQPPGSIDVILMDMMMPVMDGLEATRTIRASDHPEAKTIPIVALTANAFEEDVRKVREAGMNAHLSKPIQVGVMTRVLARYRKEVRIS